MSLIPFVLQMSGPDPQPATPEQIEALRHSFLKMHEFHPGDVVMWKPGMRNRDVLTYGEAAVVMERHPPKSVPDDVTPFMPAYHEVLDLVIGCIINRTFSCITVDSRRFQPYDLNEARDLRQAAKAEAEHHHKQAGEAVGQQIRQFMEGLDPPPGASPENPYFPGDEQ